MLIIEKLKDVKLLDCLTILKSLFPILRLWIDVKLEYSWLSVPWASGITIIKCIPHLWVLLGEVSREISKNRIGITFAETSNDILSILYLWRELSILSICDQNFLKSIYSSSDSSLNVTNYLNFKNKNNDLMFILSY